MPSSRPAIPWVALLAGLVATATAAPTRLEIDPGRTLQTIEGMGCGAIFYEGHITSLAARQKSAEQEALYDAMFKDVRTDFLHLMIRHDHEPENDNADPYKPEFRDGWFKYCDHTLAVAKAALARQPKMQFYATLYTPPPWMKTNNDVSAGGKERATVKPGSELELGEFCWAFLAHLHRHGVTVRYLSLCNEPDWPHTQPGYCLTAESHATLTKKVAAYFEEMARRFPDVPKPLLVAPNTLSAVDAAKNWVPAVLKAAGPAVAVVGAHDYDRRGDRWRQLADAAKGRPVWMTEWCVNGKDDSPAFIRSAGEFWLAMSEAFNGGATAWMAYDWVYPPRQGGEALIHVDWGKSYHPTKIYHGYRQWCSGIEPGMKVVKTQLSGPAASDFSKPGVKACAFISADGKNLVVHAAAVQDAAAAVQVSLRGSRSWKPVGHWRTSGSEDMAALPAPTAMRGTFDEEIPARAMVTWTFSAP